MAAYFPTQRLEFDYYFENGQRRMVSRMRHSNIYVLLPPGRGYECIRALYCERVTTTAGKVFRIVVWTSTGALVGSVGGPVGTGLGALVGFGIGACTIL